MISVDVFYDGWGEHWRWGTLATTTALTGRPVTVFEYSPEAQKKGLELASYTLPLAGPKLRSDFPLHQLGLPGPVYDSLPDGWGMLLMDRLFRKRGLNIARIGPLERLTYIGSNAMGAMSYKPVSPDVASVQEDIPVSQLAAEVQEVLKGEGGEFLNRLLLMGGSPQGARPKALLYRHSAMDEFTTIPSQELEPWLIKFPARQEHPEVCAVEMVYSQCLRECGIETPETRYFELPDGQAAFASRRFDREREMKVPMQSLAAFTGANYQIPGSMDYANFIRATQLCTNDISEKKRAFERVVFNVIFNNRDDHPKNFAYLMSQEGSWSLAPAFDITFCDGPGGYHQMDVMGEALSIELKHLVALGTREAELEVNQIDELIERISSVATTFSAKCRDLLPEKVTKDTISYIQNRINENIAGMQSK
ncbi:type II toxin-antitoxin system HipA family toxin [Enterobacter sp. KBR-315C3_2022]|uniref:type II toxin-antitoxin system HipA family toxin n=1 Tax=Enterobacter sp. KBR-315C3_2022 TaxID=3242494 RepID=UPI003528FEFD